MSRRRFIVLIIAALVAISGALYLSTERNLTRDTHGLPLLPSLAGELNTVTELTVRKGSATPAVTIHRQGEQWTVAERANYPADVSKLRKLLLALSDVKIREEKTSNPASYSVIGVEDPALPNAAGVQIDVVARDGKHAVIVGKPVGEGSFVRRAGENSSYIVEPAISVEAQPRFWIDTRLLDLPADKIQSIDAKLAGEPGYSLHRVSAPAPAAAAAAPAPAPAPAAAATAEAGSAKNTGAAAAAGSTFTLTGVPSGRKAADSELLAPSPTSFGGLTADDVGAPGDLDFSKASIVTLTLSDGSIVTFTGTAIGDKHWIQVAQPSDAALTARTAGRAFEIPAYRYEAIFKPLEQLLVPKSAPAKKNGASVPKKSMPSPAS
ncbi:MAG TPA: DUF4340 domain-containing protein [Steroidobacteraceae bacterium]|jgi:hypothetical protein|nr:DUF4340 domain-containing protein [Steroidobacteraceae bacterium]